jgi:hypothetical protein
LRPDGSSDETAFGEILRHKEGDAVRWLVQDAKDIHLAPGAAYSWQQDVGARWPELFAPGLNTLTIKDMTDDAGAVPSNEVKVRLEVSASTFNDLLRIVSAEKSSLDSRVWAKDWIHRVDPDFQFATGETTSEEGRTNAAAVAAARDWWEHHKNDAEVKSRIEKLNAPAGASAARQD